MANKMYWAARCKKCRGMVGYRGVRYTVDAHGVNVEELQPQAAFARIIPSILLAVCY